MASQRQREANRRNGRKGGPRTVAGKQRSCLNRLKHGLTSATLVVLPEEHEHEYEEVLRGFRQSFNPRDPAEEALVSRLAQSHWRSLRARRVETGILHVTAKTVRGRARKMVENCPENLNPHEAIGVGFMTMPPEQWQMYLRYDTTISRDFFRTLDALTKLQRTRTAVGQEPPPAASRVVEPSEPEPPRALAAGAQAPLSGYGIRSVSQTPPAAIQAHESKAETNTPSPSDQAPANDSPPRNAHLPTRGAIKYWLTRRFGLTIPPPSIILKVLGRGAAAISSRRCGSGLLRTVR